MQIQLKRCTKCQVWRECSEYSKHQRTKDGLRPSCKPCNRRYNVDYYQSNIEAAKDARRRYREENREAVREMCREWNRRNKERHRENTRLWAARNVARRRRTNAAWRIANLDRKRATTRAWTKANLARKNESWHRRYARKRRQFAADVVRSEIWLRDGGICGICGGPADPNRWHLDHVVPLSRGGLHGPDNVQVSHPACNLSKGARLMSELTHG